MKKLATIVVMLALAFELSGCANMSRRDEGLLAGGVVGAAAGNVLTGGSTAGTAVGAVGGAYAGSKLAE